MEHNCQYVCSRGIARSCKYHDKDLRSGDNEVRYTINQPKKILGLDKIFPSTVYVSTNALKEFVSKVLPTLQNKFILISGDSDLTVPNDCMDSALVILRHSNLIKWYSQNCFGGHPKLAQIPIGLDYHTLTNTTGHKWGEGTNPVTQENELKKIASYSNPLSDRKLKCYGNFHFNWYASADREDALKTINPAVIDYQSGFLKRSETWIEMAKYVFIPSPPGAGPDCHRTWEALALGCIPIVKSSPLNPLFDDLPVWIVNEWTDITPESMAKTLAHIQTRGIDYTKLQLKYWVTKINDAQ